VGWRWRRDADGFYPDADAFPIDLDESHAWELDHCTVRLP